VQKQLREMRDRVLDNGRLASTDTLLEGECDDGLIGFGALDRLGSDGHVIFSDISADLLDRFRPIAARLGAVERCDFLQASADDLAPVPDASVDVVTTRSVLIYGADKLGAHREFHRVLRSAGRISLFEPINRFTWPEPHGFFYGYDLRPIEDLLARVRAVYDGLRGIACRYTPMMNADSASESQVSMNDEASVQPPVESWSVSNLDLDPENARLPDEFTDRTQLGLLRLFDEAYALEELAWSMAERGYSPEEPLLTIAGPASADRRVVVEGNRRLATLKLLTDAELRKALGNDKWEERAQVASARDLSEVPTRNYPNREALLDYLGFRHVSGLLQWTPEAKARFVHRLVTQYGYSFEKAAKVIGSRKDAIRRQFVAWSSLEQARLADIDVSPALRHFGVFYRALQNPRIREFLKLRGWNEDVEELREPLEGDGPSQLGEFLELVFGKRRVIRESRQLDNLGKVLADPSAYAVLRDERDLALALQELAADRTAVYSAIRLAYRQAARAYAEAWQFPNDGDLVAEARKLRDLVARLLETLEASDRARPAER
jgi:ubiquinone/menaquinone biosynthesis C-methylase UbiE